MDQSKLYINPIFQPFLQCRSRTMILIGGAGSGKSHAAIIKLLLRIKYASHQGYTHRFILLRKTQKAVRLSVWRTLLHYIRKMRMETQCHITHTDMRVRFHDGSEIMCTGLDDPEKIKSIEGVDGAMFEEGTEFNVEDYRQINLRLRGPHPSYKQIIIAFNPVSRNNWVYPTFFADTILDEAPVSGTPAERIRTITREDPIRHVKSAVSALRTTWRDNMVLRRYDPEYIAEIEALQDTEPEWYDIYSLAKWGVPGDLVYRKWKVANIDPNPYAYDDWASGIDFGFNHPMVYGTYGWRDGDIYVLREYVARKTTVPEFAEAMENDLDPPRYEREMIYADSARPDSIKDLTNAGFNVEPVVKGAGSVFAGIDWLKARNIYVHPSCTQHRAELESYAWRKDRNEQPTDEPVKIGDDAMDCMRYATSRWRSEGEKLHIGVMTAKELTKGRRDTW